MTSRPIQPIARNVRRAREQRGMSVSALAAEAGISKSTLSELERGNGNPSIDTLWLVARALNLPFAALFDDDDARPTRVLRFEDAPVVTRERRGFEAKHVLTRQRRGELELYLLDLADGASRRAAGHTPGIIEHVIVISGTLEVGPDGDTEILHPGDSISFPADRPHRYMAVGGPARALSLHDYA